MCITTTTTCNSRASGTSGVAVRNKAYGRCFCLAMVSRRQVPYKYLPLTVRRASSTTRNWRVQTVVASVCRASVDFCLVEKTMWTAKKNALDDDKTKTMTSCSSSFSTNFYYIPIDTHGIASVSKFIGLFVSVLTSESLFGVHPELEPKSTPQQDTEGTVSWFSQ